MCNLQMASSRLSILQEISLLTLLGLLVNNVLCEPLPPHIESDNGSVYALEGEDVSITCTGTKNRNTFTWKFNGDEIPPDDKRIAFANIFTASLKMKLSTNYTGNYTCITETGSASVLVLIQDYSLVIKGVLPSIANDSLNASCSFTSANRITKGYHWTTIDRHGNQIILSNTSSLMIESVPTEFNGNTLTCSVEVQSVYVVKDLILSTSVNIAAIVPPSRISNAIVDLNASLGYTLGYRIPCNIEGDLVTYSWTIRGEPLSLSDPHYTLDPNNGTLIIQDSISYNHDGDYVCTAVNIADSISVTTRLHVLGAPIITTQDNQLVTGLEGQPLNLPCLYLSNPVPTVTISDGQKPLPPARYGVTNEGARILSLVPEDNGELQCLVTNSYGADTITYTVIVYSVPDSVTGFDVSENGQGSVVLSWQRFIGPEYIRPDNYTITIKDEGGTVINMYEELISTNITIDGLIPNKRYMVHGYASNRAGISQVTEYYFVTDKTAPQFQYFNITPLDGGRSLRFDWSLQYTGGEPVTTFTIQYATDSTTPTLINLDISLGTYTLTNLEPNLQYTVQPILGNRIGNTSTNYLASTLRGPAGAPTKPIVTDVQLHSVQLLFNLTSLGSDPVDYLLINVSNNDVITTVNSTHVLKTSATPSGGRVILIMVSGLDDDTTYSFSVAAGGVSVGVGPFSEYSDPVTTKSGLALYLIIGGVLFGSLFIILIPVVFFYCIKRYRTRKIGQRHAITMRPTDFGFPNSSVSENTNTVEAGYTPPTSSLGDHKEEFLSPPPYPGLVRGHHNRTHSVSSTASSQLYRKPDYLRCQLDLLPTHMAAMLDTSDSAYGGSAEKGVNLYNETQLSTVQVHSVHGGFVSSEKISSSYPSIHRILTYDVDEKMPPRPNCATVV